MRYRSFWKPLDAAEMPLLETVERVKLGGEPVNRATAALSRTGEHGLAWYVIAALFAWRRPEQRERWVAAAVKVGLVYLLNTLLKLAAGRRRPPLASLGTPTGLSFPSSHATTSFAAARLYGELEPGARPVFYVYALALIASRLHFCVHYPSDLAAGAALGDATGRALGRTR